MPSMTIEVDREFLKHIIDVCNTSIENTRECLNILDDTVGRSRMKNLRLAKVYEQDIKDADFTMHQAMMKLDMMDTN